MTLKGDLELRKKRFHEDIPIEYKINPKGFPELRFCLLDTSSSMALSPDNDGNIGKTNIITWGDNSKYHYALLAWYGLLEYLKQNYLLKQTGISLGNFSNKTILGKGLHEAKEIALNPQWGGTVLDLKKVKEIFEGNKMLLFTISDGEIGNWPSIKSSFIENVKKHHYFHLQIGIRNDMSDDLEKEGLFVEFIKGNHDLAYKVIDLTDKMYRGAT